MSDTTQEAPASNDAEAALLADLARVQAEYDEAVGDLLAQKRSGGPIDSTVKRRADRAQQALFDIRSYIREIGQAVGKRTEWIESVDNTDDDVPTLLEGA